MLALVTGAAGALGAAVAKKLRADGFDLVLNDIEAARPRLETLAKEFGARAMAGELTGLDGVTHAALIAGGWRGGAPLSEQNDDETYRAMMEMNADTVHHALRLLLRGMVEKKTGSIVVVGSRNVERPWTGASAAAYTASKSAAVALARAAAAEVVQHGVRVNAIMPSTMDTGANRRAMPDADPSKWVTVESVAGVVAFLLSDAAKDVSGAVIPVYGRA